MGESDDTAATDTHHESRNVSTTDGGAPISGPRAGSGPTMTTANHDAVDPDPTSEKHDDHAITTPDNTAPRPGHVDGVVAEDEDPRNAAADVNDPDVHRGGIATMDTHVRLKRETRRRFFASLVSSLFYLVAVVFLILTIIGNTSDSMVLRSTYFFHLDLSRIIPASYGTSIVFANSIARSLGLYDFYNVGLWNYCAGYYGPTRVVYCSAPRALWWFDPVRILVSQLLAGATIVLPSEINDILRLIRIASRVMFGFFLTGLGMNFVAMLLAPLVVFSRWVSAGFAVGAFLAALLTTAAAVIATVMFVVFRNVATSQAELNIAASIGTQMFVFMWLGAAFSILAWLLHTALCCCCLSRRDVRRGGARGCWCGARRKKRGRYSMAAAAAAANSPRKSMSDDTTDTPPEKPSRRRPWTRAVGRWG